MSNKDGGLIKLHYRDNKELLDLLSVINDKLHYNNLPVLRVSEEQNNVIVEKEDGIYVDGSCILTKEQFDLLNRFSFDGKELLFDSIIVSREYTTDDLFDMVDSVWDLMNQYYPEFDISEKENEDTEEQPGVDIPEENIPDESNDNVIKEEVTNDN